MTNQTWTLASRFAHSIVAGLILLVSLSSAQAQTPETIHVDGFDLPKYSERLRPETRAGLEQSTALYKQARERCDPGSKTTGPEIRACEALFYPPLIASARTVYNVDIKPMMIGGIQTDVVTPAEGVSRENAGRVLINAHGGGFKLGARFGGQLEAMPLAAIGKYKVVTVDYRMAPEHRFPQGSDDIVAVYRELLKDHTPSQIGIYGCSAGAKMIGSAIATIIKQGLPLPGAAAFLCSAALRWGGDSNIIAFALRGAKPSSTRFTEGYFKGVSPEDPIAFPAEFDDMLSKFPPSLLMTSTRDYSMSTVVDMHARMIRLGRDAELHVFEGLVHGAFMSPDIPEGRESALIISKFFDTRLAKDRPKK